MNTNKTVGQQLFELVNPESNWASLRAVRKAEYENVANNWGRRNNVKPKDEQTDDRTFCVVAHQC
jgi:hypothetical protein